MTDIPISSVTVTLSAEELAKRVALMIKIANAKGCNEQVIAIGLGITDADKGGNAALNLPKILPQLLAGSDWDKRLDVSGGTSKTGKPIPDGKLTEDELSAALIAAVEVASNRNIKLSDVGIDEIVQLSPEKCQQIQRGSKGQCKAP